MKDIAKQKTLEQYVEDRDRTVELLKQGRRILEESEAVFSRCCRWGYNPLPRESEQNLIEEIDRGFWRAAFRLTGFDKLMDMQAKEQFERSLESKPPQFSIENIRSTFAGLFQDADMMFARGVANVFRRLSKSHRTNQDQPFKIGEKAIITSMVRTDFGAPSINYGWQERYLEDLHRVMVTMDGKEYKEGALVPAINASFKQCYDMKVPLVHEDDYYRIKGFRNGNLHIQFKRLDLLDEVNKTIARYYKEKALGKAPAGYGEHAAV